MRAARAKALPAGASALVLLADEVGGRGDGPPVAVDESLACEPLALGEGETAGTDRRQHVCVAAR